MPAKYEKGKEAKGGSSFETLKAIEISPYIEKKNNYDYLSWAVALDILYTHFPKASYEVHTCEQGHPFFKSELGYYVIISVTIDEKTETEYHPVTGHNNKAILKPTMVDINASIKRGLAKTIAQHGLGLDLWIGEDLQHGKPGGKTTTAKKLNEASQEEEDAATISHANREKKLQAIADGEGPLANTARGHIKERDAKAIQAETYERLGLTDVYIDSIDELYVNSLQRIREETKDADKPGLFNLIKGRRQALGHDAEIVIAMAQKLFKRAPQQLSEEDLRAMIVKMDEMVKAQLESPAMSV